MHDRCRYRLLQAFGPIEGKIHLFLIRRTYGWPEGFWNVLAGLWEEHVCLPSAFWTDSYWLRQKARGYR